MQLLQGKILPRIVALLAWKVIMWFMSIADENKSVVQHVGCIV
jgi:hypothetical protein